jgi:hypothetical protein
MKTAHLVFFLVLCLILTPAGAGQPDPPGQVRNGTPVYEAYLFAHMLHSDYGRLYYSVSLDGLHWTMLNEGRRVYDVLPGG